MKAFAREICRNDLLNFGRLHFFFPDSRMSLDLNTDKTLKVALLLGILDIQSIVSYKTTWTAQPSCHCLSNMEMICPLILLDAAYRPWTG